MFHNCIANENCYLSLLTKFTTALCEAEMEKDDQLLDQLLQSRSLAMERVKASRQTFILVASLLDRIPNLAGLARTCEVCYGAHNTRFFFFFSLPSAPPFSPLLSCFKIFRNSLSFWDNR